MPGLVALVERADGADAADVEIEVIGRMAFDGPPMQRDSIFRIASLSKPISAAVAMLLVQDGTLRLDQRIDQLLPELAARPVLRSLDAPLDDTVPPTRPITVFDVLTFRLGFGFIMAPPATYPIQRAEAEMQLRTLGPPWPPSPHLNDQWIALLGTLPFMHQPGQQWMYNTGSQVLGVLIERAAGQPLETVMRERLFEPLGMVDTGFSVPSHSLARLTTAYAPDPVTGAVHVLDAAGDSWWAQPPAMPNASGWLVSTLDDLWSFARMMAADGLHDGRAVLSPASIEMMTTDHLTEQQRADSALFLDDHNGWGLGMSVPAANGATGVPGGYGWTGGTGTAWANDRSAGITGILLTQRAMTSPEPPAVFADFWECAYSLS
ncbi:MAG: hypothetical protein JWN99_929 [Ilumatobacteraceae bacterium]|nr:hypothetical protein [Ilumatobacteraceae bacterium]